MKIGSRKNKNHLKGLTLIEIVLVLALLGMVVAFIGNKVFKTFNKAKSKIAAGYLAEIRSSLEEYKIDCNDYPKTFEGLYKNPGDCPAYDPQGYITKKSYKDPYGCTPFYSYDGGNIVLKSLGKGCAEGGEGEATDIEYTE